MRREQDPVAREELGHVDLESGVGCGRAPYGPVTMDCLTIWASTATRWRIWMAMWDRLAARRERLRSPRGRRAFMQ